MRRVRYSVAVSLDGFIGGPSGEHDWIVMDPSIDMRELFASIDTVLIGRGTFEQARRQGRGGSMPGVDAIVCSRTLRPADHPDVVIHDDAACAVVDLKGKSGKDIWLMGGGGLFRSLLDARLVDAIELAVMPVLLGAGVPLLPGSQARHPLKVVSSKALPSGVILSTYEPSRPSVDELELRWAASRSAQRTGSVATLVARVGKGKHATPARVELTPEGGVDGDRWRSGEAPDPDAMVTLIDRRVAEVLVDGDPERLHVPGDNIVVDLDLDEASLPVGARLRVGSAEAVVTPKPHRGCAKFRARLGDQALRWISAKEHEGRRLRGVYVRVVTPGVVAIGDRVARVEG